MILLELCVRVSKPLKSHPSRTRTLLDCKLQYIWRWTDYTSYVIFVAIFTSLSLSLAYIFRDFHSFIELIGYCSTLSDAALALPQALENFKNKSVKGMSIWMVLMWLVGDLFKTCYFIIKSQPIQFLVCGMTQITLDIIILVQVLVYKN